MNDLARQGLDTAGAALRAVRDRPMPYVGGAGFALGCGTVVAGARVAAALPEPAFVNWFGLEDQHDLGHGQLLPGIAMLCCLGALVLLWAATVAIVRRRSVRPRTVWWVGAAWLAPFAMGPPQMGTSLYGYVAYGLIQHRGGNPYAVGPAVLGDARIALAVDPASRTTPSSAGPLGSVLQHLAVTASGGSALGALIVLRIVGVLVALWLGHESLRLARRRARGVALALSVLNPLVLLYVVSDARLDGLMVVLVLVALTAARSRRWTRAAAAAALAGSVLPPALVVVPLVVGAHSVRVRTGRTRVIAVARDAGAASGIVALTAALPPAGWHWLSSVTDQFSGRTPFAAASLVGQLFAPVVRDASYDDLLASGRLSAIVAAICICFYLLGTTRRRPLASTAGYLLLTLALLGPALQPWYLLWGTLCLAPRANGVRRVWVIALCSAACLLSPPGFSDVTSDRITVPIVAVIAVTAGLALGRRPGERSGEGQWPSAMSRTAGRTSAR